MKGQLKIHFWESFIFFSSNAVFGNALNQTNTFLRLRDLVYILLATPNGIKHWCFPAQKCRVWLSQLINNLLYFAVAQKLNGSCTELLDNGLASSGVYTISPDGGKPTQVFCDLTTDGGGWTVFQRRLDGSIDFYLDWESYKNGFGDLNGEFWLGNDNLHRLTAADDVILRIDLEDFDGNKT